MTTTVMTTQKWTYLVQIDNSFHSFETFDSAKGYMLNYLRKRIRNAQQKYTCGVKVSSVMMPFIEELTESDSFFDSEYSPRPVCDMQIVYRRVPLEH